MIYNLISRFITQAISVCSNRNLPAIYIPHVVYSLTKKNHLQIYAISHLKQHIKYITDAMRLYGLMTNVNT